MTKVLNFLVRAAEIFIKLIAGLIFYPRSKKIEKYISSACIPAGITYTAHTGCCKTKPNTLECIDVGAKYGAGIVEFDLRFDKNSEPVLSHDEPVGGEVTLDEAFAKIINDYRFDKDHNSVKLTLSNELCEVARIAAQEYALKTNSAFIREDGSLFYKLLDEKGIEYTYVDKIVIYSGFGYSQAAEEMLEDFQGEKMLSSATYSKIGVGAYSTDNRTFYWCVFVIR
jgi:uncharacterized protein YkwD